MLDDAMPGEAITSNGSLGEFKSCSDNYANQTLQEMAEKLEKSEAARKKFRKVTLLLKEKLDATEQVLQVNDTLRQECEKERKRAEAERNRAEEEKKLREQIEKESFSTKEQLILVLNRLDAVERDCKSDRNEVERMQKEVKQAVSALNGAVTIIEGASVSFQNLEKNLLGKISNAVSTSSKAMSLAQNAVTDSKGAQGSASLAERLSQSLESRIAVLQKQSASLDQRLNLLQQELQTRLLESKQTSNEDKSLNGKCSAAEKRSPLNRGMVLSKSQQPIGACTNSPMLIRKESLTRSTGPTSYQAGRSEAVVDSEQTSLNSVRPASGDLVAGCGTPSPKDGRWTTSTMTAASEVSKEIQNINQGRRAPGKASANCRTSNGDMSVDGALSLEKRHPDSSSRNIIREALDAAKRKGNLSRSTSLNRSSLKPEITTCIQGTNLARSPNGIVAVHKNQKDNEVHHSGARTKVDTSSRSLPAFVGADSNEHVQNDSPVPHTGSNNVDRLENCSHLGAPIIEKGSRAAELKGTELTVPIVSPLPLVLTRADKRTDSLKRRDKGQKENLPGVLLKDISKLFQKEKKSRAKMENKLAALQKMLQSGNSNEIMEQDFPDVLEKSDSRRKRKGTSIVVKSRKKVCIQDTEGKLYSTPLKSLVAGDNDSNLSERAAEGGVEASKMKSNKTVMQKDFVGSEDHQTCLLQDKGNLCLSGPHGGPVPVASHSVLFEELQELPGCATERMLNADSCLRHDDELNGGWDSETETSDDSLDNDWWEKKGVLLSPTLPKVVRPTGPLSELPLSNFDSAWPTTGQMSFEEISQFLDILPPIANDGKACEEIVIDGAVTGAVTKAVDPKDKIEGSCVKSFEMVSMEENVKELSTVVACQPKETLKERTEETCLKSIEIISCGENAKDLSAAEDSETKETRDSLNRAKACREISPERGVEPPWQVGKAGNSDKEKETMIGGLSSHSTTSSACEQVLPSAILSQEDIFDYSKLIGPSSYAAHASGGGTHPIMGSPCPVTSETQHGQSLAMDHCEELFSLFSLDFICNQSAVDQKINSTENVMEDLTYPSPTQRSKQVIMSVERIRNLLCEPLSHTKGALVSNTTTDVICIFSDSTFSREDLICIFMASLVDAYALWDSELHPTSLIAESETLQCLINTCTEAFVTEMFQALPSDQPFSLFASQLQKFLIQGSIQPSCWLNPDKDDEEGNALEYSFHFVPPTSEEKKHKALISGSKLLASFCKTSGKLDILHNSIYLILRFCSKDSLWLLEAISSFAVVCGKSLFAIHNSDNVGQAIFVIISELLNDTEVMRESKVKDESQKACSGQARDTAEVQLEVQQGSQNVSKEMPGIIQHTDNFSILREIIGQESGLSFEVFVPKLLISFHNVIRPAFDCNIQANQHIFLRSLQISVWDPTRTEKISGRSFELLTSMETSHTGSPGYYWQVTKSSKRPIDCPTLDSGSQSVPESRCVNEWQETFHDLVRALELVASHLGWEWTYNDLIVEHLWKLVTPEAPAVTVACVAHVFGVLGRLGREVDSTELPGVDELRKSLLVVLSPDPDSMSCSGCSHHRFSFTAQVAAAEALWSLCNTRGKDVMNCSKAGGTISVGSQLQAEYLKSLLSWFKALTPEMQDVLPSSLSAFFSPEKSIKSFD